MFGNLRVAVTLLTLIAAASNPPAAFAQDQTADRFDMMKRMVGTWRIADEPSSLLRIRFYVTAGGTVLAESWERGDQPHSLTLYHRDSAAIVATHYCPQGNQPRLTSLSGGRDAVIRFAFRNATDLDPNESYLVALAFDLSDETVLVRRETYRSNDGDEASELRLMRER